jgi:SAM-dependent methyltransferase
VNAPVSPGLVDAGWDPTREPGGKGYLVVDQQAYYEQPAHWDRDYQSVDSERQRIAETIALIPDDVTSILDVGCGNGAFLNSLPGTCKTLGIDFSEAALKHVRTETKHCHIASLDVPDRSFDLVTCLEVLEHLDQQTFPAALAELERAANRYIVVSVPNRQRLDLSLVACPACLCHFNPTYHVRSFGSDDLSRLFRRFRPIRIVECGPVERRNNLPAVAASTYRALLREPPPATALCPQCGYAAAAESAPPLRIADDNSRPSARGRTFARAALSPVKWAGRLLWPKVSRKRWLMALYGTD